MKYTLLLATLLPAMVWMVGCKEEVSNTANIARMEDTVFKSFPTVNGVSIEVKDFADVDITIRDKELYNYTEDKRQDATDKIALMTVHIFGKDNHLKNGKVIFVENETSIDKDAVKKTYDMHLEKLVKQ